MDAAAHAEAMRRARAVRLLCLDVDGTLTDGTVLLAGGVVCRQFSVLDGLGVQRFVAGGGVAAIVTAAAEGEGGADIRARAEKMGIRHTYIGVYDKRAVVEQLLQAEGFAAEQAAFVGDDLPDLPAMQAVGFAAAPPTAVAAVQAVAHYIATLPAGGGAVREVCEFILTAQADGAGG